MGTALLILTGASGSGKTTLAKALGGARPEIHVAFFDSVGVPGAEEMATLGADQWQRATTLRWITELKPALAAGRKVLFEGQMRIAFTKEALATASLADARILLVDCDDWVRIDRLIHGRRQPELADETMMDWASYLRQESGQFGCEVLDTGKLTIAESVALMSGYLA